MGLMFAIRMGNVETHGMGRNEGKTQCGLPFGPDTNVSRIAGLPVTCKECLKTTELNTMKTTKVTRLTRQQRSQVRKFLRSASAKNPHRGKTWDDRGTLKEMKRRNGKALAADGREAHVLYVQDAGAGSITVTQILAMAKYSWGA